MNAMEHDPFGNLSDWAPVVDLLQELETNGQLANCQPGLVRILRYKGNWRLREAVLERIGKIQNPSDELISQVINILDDDNIYYDARILASDALIPLLKKTKNGLHNNISIDLRKVARKLRTTPQPPFFNNALNKLFSEYGLPITLEN